jgi:preprotein translocase subunit SecY
MKSELARRIVFTLGALLVYRLGSYVPLPGVSVSGPQIPGVTIVPASRFSFFSSGILPYLSAAILIQLVSMVSSKLSALPGSVVFVELARRRVPVEFASRKLGSRLLPAQSTHLSLKLNSAGLMPPVVAPWLYLLSLTVAGLPFDPTSPWLLAVYRLIQENHMGRVILSSVAIVILAFIYTAFVVDPEHAADSPRKIEPGEATAAHLDRVVSYTTCIGAVYLGAVFLIPELLLTCSQAPFYLGGASVLVVVCTFLDIETQVRGRSLTEPGGVYS